MSSQPTEAGKTPPPTPGPSSEHPSCRNEIWQTAIDRYYDELAKSGVPVSTIDKDIWNIEGPDQVVKQVKSLAAVQAIQNSKLESILHSLNDFVMLTAWAVGMNGKVAAVLWGSIRLIIKV